MVQSHSDWYLLLARPRFEGVACNFIANNLSAEVYYPTKPDPKNPANKVAAVSGYILAKPKDPDAPFCSEDFAPCVTASPRFMMVFSHTEPASSRPSPRFHDSPDNEHMKDILKSQRRRPPVAIFKPHRFNDKDVAEFSKHANAFEQAIVPKLIHQIIQIPYGPFQYYHGEIVKIVKDNCQIQIIERDAVNKVFTCIPVDYVVKHSEIIRDRKDVLE